MASFSGGEAEIFLVIILRNQESCFINISAKESLDVITKKLKKSSIKNEGIKLSLLRRFITPNSIYHFRGVARWGTRRTPKPENVVEKWSCLPGMYKMTKFLENPILYEPPPRNFLKNSILN